MKKSFNKIAPILSILVIGMLSIGMIEPILPLYLVHIGFSSKATGVIISVLWLGMIIGESSWGWIADKIGIRIPMIWGTLVSGIILLGFLLAKGTYIVFIAILCLGLFRSSVFGPARGHVGKHAPALKKAAFMGIIIVAMGSSRSLGALLSGFLASSLGYTWVFYITIGIYILGGLITIITLRDLKYSAPKLSPVSKQLFVKDLKNYHCLFSLCAITSCEFFGIGLFISFLPLLITQVAGLSVTSVGILFTMRGIITMVFGVPMGMLADRKGKKLLMIIALAISAMSMIGISLANSFFSFLISVILLEIGLATYSPAALALLSDSVPSEHQGSVMGMYGGICENTGIMAGAFSGGFVWNIFGPRATFWLGSLVCIIGVIMCLILNIEEMERVNKLTNEINGNKIM
jgi:PPP family 3-phenylpropionic acid transporter